MSFHNNAQYQIPALVAALQAHHLEHDRPSQAADFFLMAAREAGDAEIERLKDALTFVERWANHHAQKPHVTAAEALSCIQHYPEIEAITESYADGKVPETRDPYAEIAALQQEVDNALALWTVAHAERSEAMSHGARLEAEIAALKAERDALLKNDARYRFVVGSTDHSVAKWHDCEGWYAIDEFDVDADMREQAVKS